MKSIRIADIMMNDVVDGLNVCVSLWVQGCGHHCFNCHNPQTWDFNLGTEMEVELLAKTLIDDIKANDINRNFSVLGGEPLCDENIEGVAYIIKKIREEYNDILIFVWTGDTYENLYKRIPFNENIKIVFDNIDVLIDGPYIDSKRDITLFLRGSSNQRVIDIKKMREENSWNNVILYSK